MAGQRKIALFLRALDNEYQELQKFDFLKRAELHRLSATVFDAKNDARVQFRQIEDVVRAHERYGFVALLVNPVQESMLQPLAAEAARNGIGWASLNRFCEYVRELRRRYKKISLFCVDPDQRQIGHIQGQQFMTLLRKGGALFYLCGPLSTSSAKLRLVGVEIAIAGTAIRMSTSSADWSMEGGFSAMRLWLRNDPSRKWRHCIVGAQNDTMALGARKALLEEAEEQKRPALAKVRVTGCDGLPGSGQRAVADGFLAATVVVPTTAGKAVDVMASALASGRPPSTDVVLEVASFPDLDALSRLAPLPSTLPPGQQARARDAPRAPRRSGAAPPKPRLSRRSK